MKLGIKGTSVPDSVEGLVEGGATPTWLEHTRHAYKQTNTNKRAVQNRSHTKHAHTPHTNTHTYTLHICKGELIDQANPRR